MQLLTLGTLDLHGTPLHRPKSLLLLAYLAIEGGRDRTHLRELFWPGAADPAASLRVALVRIRATAPKALNDDGTFLSLGCPSDVSELLEAMQDRPSQVPALYSGAFLAGISLAGWGGELEEWVYTTREYLGGQVRENLLLQAEALATTDVRAAAQLAEQALRVQGAPVCDPTDLQRLGPLLTRGKSPAANEVRRLAQDYGLTLTLPDGPEVLPSSPSHRSDPAPPAGGAATATSTLRPAGTQTAILPSRSGRRSTFVGRQLEVNVALQAIRQRDTALLTLLGAGGAGKTRLALELFDLCAAEGLFTGGQYVLALESVHTEAELLSALAQGLGLSSTLQLDIYTIAAAIGSRSTLLLLDNFEQLSGCALLLAVLLQRCEHLQLLVTSRQSLGLGGETVLPVGGLQLPASTSRSWDDALESEAVQLFVQLARKARLDLQLTAEDLLPVVTLLRQLDGVPLAIELAAAWIRVMTPAQIVAELTRGLDDLLVSTEHDTEERHRSLRAVFNTSWALLSEREQRTLRQLSVFVRGFTREAAAEVAGATLQVLLSLVSKSLLRLDVDGRYSWHPLVYSFAADLLAAQLTEWAEVQARHTAQVLAFVQNAQEQIKGPQELAWFKRLRAELENIRAVIARLARQENWTQISELGDWLFHFLFAQGLFVEGLSWIATLPESFLRQDARGLRVKGGLAVALGDLELARETLLRGLELIGRLPRPLTPEQLRVNAMLNLHLAHTEVRAGRTVQCALYADEALKNLQITGDVYAQAVTLGLLGGLHANTGNYSQARQVLEQALRLSQHTGRSWGELVPRHNLGEFLYASGEYAAATNQYREVSQLAGEFDDPNWQASALTRLGELALLNGDIQFAGQQIREAFDLLVRIDDRCNLLRTINTVGQLAQALGKLERAVQLWGAAAAGHVRLGIKLEPLPQRSVDRSVGQVRQWLDTSAFAHHWTVGEQMAWGAMLSLAERELPSP